MWPGFDSFYCDLNKVIIIVILLKIIITINGISITFSITIIPHCLNQRDDIFMGGSDETEKY